MTNPTRLFSTFSSSLAFTDVNGAGVWTAVDPTRYAELGAQNGIWVEEAVTNLILNPTAGTNTTGWATGGSRTITQDTSLPAALPAPLASTVTTGFECAATANLTSNVWTAAGYSGITLTAAAYTFSAYVYIPTAWTSGTPIIQHAAFTSATGEANASSDIDTRDAWQRIDVTFTPDAGDVLGNLQIMVNGVWNSGDTLWVAAAQCEQNAYTTSYTDGAQGDGYAWTGTAHASTSTRAASSVSVDQDTVARIDPASGAIAFRYKRLIDTGAEEIILTSGVVGAGTDYLEIGVDTSDDLYMEWNSDNAGAERVTIATTIDVDTNYFFYFDWDGTAIRASIDNGTLSSDTRAAAEGDWSTGDLTLSAAVGSHVVGPFAVFDRPLTTKEITYLDTHNTWSFGMLPLGSRANIFQLRPKAVT